MNLGENLIIALVALMTLVSALMVVGSRKLVHAGFWLLPFLLGIGGCYLILEVSILFAAQLIIYAGAVAVLVLFVIFLTQDVMNPQMPQVNRLAFLGAAVGLGLFLILATVGYRELSPMASPVPPITSDTTTGIGAMLLGDYILPFEITSALLLAALIGAMYLAKNPKMDAEKASENGAMEAREEELEDGQLIAASPDHSV